MPVMPMTPVAEWANQNAAASEEPSVWSSAGGAPVPQFLLATFGGYDHDDAPRPVLTSVCHDLR
ncbi:hypothetical protein JBE04_27510 [Streptomyces sp. PRKS01-29]|nr:hypothetical protein [Streptomyces sabulosicollis]MBI0298114.1 hypothetical protein [Streptomyces sabulosicollis]